MSDPFLGEIKMFGGNFPPRGYSFCDGQILAIQQNTALFSLLGTYYGGNGTSTFALPDLRGRSPMHVGQGAGLSPRVLGEQGGSTTTQLLSNQMPSHTHVLQATTAPAAAASPTGGVWAVSGSRRATVNLYTATAGTGAVMAPTAIGIAGGGLPHNNLPPYQAITFIIAIQGIFPTRN